MYLSYLNILPDEVKGINGKDLDISIIPIETNTAEILRRI